MGVCKVSQRSDKPVSGFSCDQGPARLSQRRSPAVNETKVRMTGFSSQLNGQSFMGCPRTLGRSNGTKTMALFGGGKNKGGAGTKVLKQAQKGGQNATQTLRKNASKKAGKGPSGPQGAGGSGGYKKYQDDARWLPNTPRPEWLDGTLPGDRGFDPLGLAKPAEYLQYDVDQLDQNKAVNKAGKVLGQFKSNSSGAPRAQSLAPYDEVFGLTRFRETELIHGRWAMLATLGVLVGEASTGVSWVDAGKVELDGAQYLGFRLPFTISQLCWIEAILVGGAEVYRNGELNSEKRIYPGGYFDPLSLVDGQDEARTFRLKEAEIKHGRLAMVAFLGFAVQAGVTGQGALGSLAKFSGSFAPELVEDVEKALGQVPGQ
ncbi:hypothetical protein WJX84_009826 [Apatococcus fuscideae]|uniref:Chlorophyll a-b binding protein, chloroplastic n=1 Tax=Apatococcus fuscideae TaxID=2026836 RepID=A0AAW1STP4_9CHLO